MQVIVRTLANSFFVFDVEPTDSVGFLKEQIAGKTHKQRSDLMLVCAGFPLDEEAMLLDVNVADQAVIHVVWDVSPHLHLFVLSLLDGGFYSLLTHPREKVRVLTQKIQAREGIPVCQQCLTFNEIVLEDDDDFLFHRFADGCTLVLRLRAFPCSGTSDV
jgi:hypothetical protein